MPTPGPEPGRRVGDSTVTKIPSKLPDPHVALTIDDYGWPYSVLLVRGTAEVVLRLPAVTARRLCAGDMPIWPSSCSKSRAVYTARLR